MTTHTCSPPPSWRTCASPARTPPTTTYGGRSPTPASARGSPRSRTGRRRSSERATPTCRAASAPGWPSPGRCWATTTWWCSTSRPLTSTPRPHAPSPPRCSARTARVRFSGSPKVGSASTSAGRAWSCSVTRARGRDPGGWVRRGNPACATSQHAGRRSTRSRHGPARWSAGHCPAGADLAGSGSSQISSPSLETPKVGHRRGDGLHVEDLFHSVGELQGRDRVAGLSSIRRRHT